jgi:hypothetical protein
MEVLNWTCKNRAANNMDEETARMTLPQWAGMPAAFATEEGNRAQRLPDLQGSSVASGSGEKSQPWKSKAGMALANLRGR